MEVKKYTEADISTAMDKIRSELGRDAYILSTRNVRRKGIRGLFAKPMVEVVAAYEPPQQRSRPSQRNAAPAYTAPERTESELHEDARRLDSFFTAVRNSAMGPPMHPPVTPTYHAGLAAYGQHAVPKPIEPEFKPAGESVNPFTHPAAPKKHNDELKRLSEQVENLAQAIASLTVRSSLTQGVMRPNLRPEIAALIAPLQENEVHDEFIAKISDELAAIIDKQEADPAEVMEQLLRQYLGDPAPLRLRRFKRTVVMLVGPTGVGKTTTLAKLAAIYTLNHHAKVGVITTDTYRMAAVEQLRTYAEIMELPLSVVYSPEEMSDALRAHEDKDLVFIDTAGRSPADPAMAPEIAEYVKKSEADEVLLCVAAGTSYSSCLNLVQVYGFLKDYRLLITKLDETPVWGSLLNLRFLSQRPISYTALGQNVPDDIEALNPRKIAEHLMGRGGVPS
jgi:flagellar biosynthesis protein FlhF